MSIKYTADCSCYYQESLSSVVFWDDVEDKIICRHNAENTADAIKLMEQWKQDVPEGVRCRRLTPLYKNIETGEVFTYFAMIAEWREKYEGIDPRTKQYRYHWHTRYQYLPADD